MAGIFTKVKTSMANCQFSWICNLMSLSLTHVRPCGQFWTK